MWPIIHLLKISSPWLTKDPFDSNHGTLCCFCIISKNKSVLQPTFLFLFPSQYVRTAVMWQSWTTFHCNLDISDPLFSLILRHWCFPKWLNLFCFCVFFPQLMICPSRATLQSNKLWVSLMQSCMIYALLQVFLISCLLTATYLMKAFAVSKVTQPLLHSPPLVC